jgi:hypothetical protein
MAESDDAQVQLTSLVGLVRNHVTLVLTLIPILLGGLRIFAVANGDRPTLVTLLSTLDVKAVLLGTFDWLLPTAFGVAAAISMNSRKTWRSCCLGCEPSIRSRWPTNRDSTTARRLRSKPPSNRPLTSLPTMTSVPDGVRARRSCDSERWPAVSTMRS